MPRDAVRQLDDEVSLARLITDHAVDAIFLLDGEGRAIFANPAAEAMFGWSAEELKEQNLHDLIHYQPANHPPLPMREGPLGHVFVTGENLEAHEDIFVHRDGRQIPVSCSNAAIVRQGTVTGGVLIVRDITERRKLEKQRQLLVEELQHRVKNLLAVVQAIAHQSLSSGDMETARASFFARLSAIAEAQSLVTAHDGIEAPIHEVLDRAMRPFQTGDNVVGMQGPPITLPPRKALTLSMAIHELGTNATKYGALSSPAGRVAIVWRRVDMGTDEAFELIWQESGGPPVTPPARSGFGTRMIKRALAAEFDGHVELAYESGGLLCTLVGRLS